MSTLSYEKIILHWINTILDGVDSISLEHLKNIPMPEMLNQNFLEKGDQILDQEIKRIIGNPFFDFESESDDEFDIKTELNRLFTSRIALPATTVSEIVDTVFRGMVDSWRGEPISFREAAEDLEGFAKEIFSRIETYTSISPGKEGYELDMIAAMCEMSGLDSIAQAVRYEERVESDSLTLEEFETLADRFLKLVKFFRIDRKLTSFEGEGITLTSPPRPAQPVPEEITLPTPEPEPAPEPLPELELADLDLNEEEIKDIEAEPVMGEKLPEIPPWEDTGGSESLDDILREEIQGVEMISEDEEDMEDFELDENAIEFGDKDSEIKEFTEAVSEKLADKVIADMGLKEDADISEEVIEETAEKGEVSFELTVDTPLAQQLMLTENRDYFREELFEGDLEGYKMMAERICNAADMNRALIIADNELFMLDIPAVADSAARLLNLIREYYGKEDQ